MFDITTRGRLSAPGGIPQASGRTAAAPTLYVTRFCNFEAASLAAAVRDGLAVLDAAMAQHPALSGGPAAVVFRNRRHGTVTLDIGRAGAGEAAATGEIRFGPFPDSAYLLPRDSDVVGQQLLAAAIAATGRAAPARPRPQGQRRRAPLN